MPFPIEFEKTKHDKSDLIHVHILRYPKCICCFGYDSSPYHMAPKLLILISCTNTGVIRYFLWVFNIRTKIDRNTKILPIMYKTPVMLILVKRALFTLKTENYVITKRHARLTPKSRGTWDWLTTKKWPNSRLLWSWSTRSYVAPVTHQNVLSYSWIVAYSPLKSTSSTTAFNCQNRSWNWSISLGSDPTRRWIFLRSYVFAGWS